MNFDKYLKQHTVDKIIDPGQGDITAPTPKPTADVPNTSARDIAITPVSTVVTDLISQAKEIQTQAIGVINEINQTNSYNPNFVLYHDMVKANFFNPANLLTDINSRPSIVYQPNQIKAAERQVYRDQPDPRAPFIQDLYDHLADAGLSEYVLTKYWDQIIHPNALFDAQNIDETLIRYALNRETQHLDYLKMSMERIHKNKVQQLAYGFLRAFAHKIVGELQIIDTSEAVHQVSKLITTLNQIKGVLTVVSILNTDKWEQFSSNIKDIYGDFLQITAAKVARTAAYAIFNGLEEKITEFTQDFDSILPFDLNVLDIPEARELLSQLDGCFGHFLAQIEEDLVHRESISAKLEENRQLLYLNSRKNSQTKQFIETISEIVAYLEETKYYLSNISSLYSLEIDKLTTKLVGRIAGYSTPPINITNK